MNIPPWITTVVAVCGALVATASLWLVVRSKSWRLKVTQTYLNDPAGPQHVQVHVANVGERSVTVTSVFLQSEVYRAKLSERLWQWARKRGFGRQERTYKAYATYEATQSLTGHIMPVELKPGEAATMSLDFSRIQLEPVGPSYVGALDALGKRHYCKDTVELPRARRGRLAVSDGLNFHVVPQ
jgi:hypothetical protein